MEPPLGLEEGKCEAVAVYSGYSTEDVDTTPAMRYGCSGILWRREDQLWGITHGSVLIPFLEVESKGKIEELRRALLSNYAAPKADDLLKKLNLHILREGASEFTARVARVWTCPYLSISIGRFIDCGWDFKEDNADELLRHILPTFVVFCPTGRGVRVEEGVSDAIGALLAQIPTGGVARGSPLLTISSPFAGVLLSDNTPCISQKPCHVDTKLIRASDERGDKDGLPETADEKVIVPKNSLFGTSSAVTSPTSSNIASGRKGVAASYHTPFLNSWSEGIVSSVSGPSGILILTDARATAGSEGGPVFGVTSHGKKPAWRLAGMLLRSICFWRGEWVGFSLACYLEPILRMCLGWNMKLRSILLGAESEKSFDRDELHGVNKITSCPVVHIKCGYTRGSGIPVNGNLGLILTCAHVVEKHHLGLKVNWIKNSNEVVSLRARVIYKTPPGLAYDVAVISVGPGTGLPTLPISKELPFQGERVWAVGYALHVGSHMGNSGLMELPLLSRGIVSTVFPGELPPLLQTTCCIQSGGSGGAIIREKDGELLGMVVCNTAMDKPACGSERQEVIVFPHINISVPAIILSSPLEKYYETIDPSHLAEIHSSDERIQRIWRLQSPGTSNSSAKSKL